jgi:hypothetical protein
MGVWKPFRQEFDTFMLDFHKHHKRVEKEAGLAHLIESARRRDIEKANQALQKRNEKVKKKHSLISSLQTVDYQAKHRTISDLRHPGTNTWPQHHHQYVSWLQGQESDCLCCYGKLGSGKSVLASSVVDALQQSCTDEKTLLCYYYFHYAETRSHEINSLFGTLIKQVLVHLPLDGFGDGFNYPIGEYMSSPLADKISLLSQLFANFSKVYLVLDGLDELSHDGQSATLNLLEQLLQSKEPTVKIFVTSRAEEVLIRRRLQSHNFFDLTSTNNSDDIFLVVEAALEEAAEVNPKFLDLQLQKEVTDALVDGAKDM